MPKTKCYSVRLQSLRSISEKAYLAKAFDGSEAILPKSQVFGSDYEVQKSDAYWIASWILEQKELQYSDKKIGWYNPDTGNIEPNFDSENFIIEKHIPKRLEPVTPQPDASLIKQSAK